MTHMPAAGQASAARKERLDRILVWVWISVSMITWMTFWLVAGLILHFSLWQIVQLGGALIICNFITERASGAARRKDLQRVLNYEFTGWDPDQDHEKSAHKADPTLEVRYSDEGRPVIVRKKLTPEQQEVMDRVVDLLKRTVWANAHS